MSFIKSLSSFKTCEYMSKVVDTFSCPSLLESDTILTPFDNKKVA